MFMNCWAKLLLISLPLAIVLTIGVRFIQHTDTEYSFWVEIYAETAAMIEARCTALRSAAACARDSGVSEFQVHRDAVMLWWWPTLLAAALAWLAATLSFWGILQYGCRRRAIAAVARAKKPN
jgi:cobalamin synthase